LGEHGGHCFKSTLQDFGFYAVEKMNVNLSLFPPAVSPALYVARWHGMSLRVLIFLVLSSRWSQYDHRVSIRILRNLKLLFEM
jgi:hypothetical protein